MSDPTAISDITYTWYGPALQASTWGGWEDGTVQWDSPGEDEALSEHVSSGGGMFTLTAVDVPDGEEVQLPEGFPASSGGEFDQLVPNTKVAIHVRGSGFVASGCHWGKNDGIATNSFEQFIGGGVTFFAKRGDDPYAAQFITISYDGPSFQPAQMPARPYKLPEDIAAAGPVPPATEGCAASGSTKCYDTPVINVPLRTQWTQFILPFTAFAQQGFGLHVTEPQQALKKGANIWFNVVRSARFDVWVTGFGMFTAEHNPMP